MVRRHRHAVPALIAVFVLSVVAIVPVAANNTAQALPFAQDWTNTNLITVNDNWSGVPGVTGFRGQDITTGVDIDPQTLLGKSTLAGDLDVFRTSPRSSRTAVSASTTSPTQSLACRRTPVPMRHISCSTSIRRVPAMSRSRTTSRHRRDWRQRGSASRPPVSGRPSGSFTNVPAVTSRMPNGAQHRHPRHTGGGNAAVERRWTASRPGQGHDNERRGQRRVDRHR